MPITLAIGFEVIRGHGHALRPRSMSNWTKISQNLTKRRISHQRNGVSVHEGHQVFVRQGKIGHVCINYANKLKVSTNDLELFAG